MAYWCAGPSSKELGYRVHVASNCDEGLKLYKASNFDVVVTDHCLPGLNGIDLIARIRKVNPNARVVLVCGLIEPLGLTEENTGADAVIAKNVKEPVQLGRSVKASDHARSRTQTTGQTGTSAGSRARNSALICHTEIVSPLFSRILTAGICSVALAAPAARKPEAKSAPIKASPVVRRWMKGMTLRDEVAQLVFIAFHGESPNTRSRDTRFIRDARVGGLLLNNVSNGHTIQKAEPYKVAACTHGESSLRM